LVHIEMIDLLRCVNAHEDTWLVASFREIANRIVVQGTLGCPVCGAQYEITDGVVDFTRGESITEYEAERAVASHRREELATRAGAYLDATQPGATIVLGGLWAYAAEDLANMADVRVIALDAPKQVKESERVGLVRISDRVPLAANSVHGIALDAWFRRAAVDEATRVTRPLSRIVGPTLLPPPDAAVVLAHDEQYWVAEKAAEMISLKRPRSEAGTTTSADRG
jgi:uncharacterized protein YbaR (Trm112 family)